MQSILIICLCSWIRSYLPPKNIDRKPWPDYDVICHLPFLFNILGLTLFQSGGQFMSTPLLLHPPPEFQTFLLPCWWGNNTLMHMSSLIYLHMYLKKWRTFYQLSDLQACRSKLRSHNMLAEYMRKKRKKKSSHALGKAIFFSDRNSKWFERMCYHLAAFLKYSDDILSAIDNSKLFPIKQK